ncbi:MAG: hypothetical protein ACXWE6_14445, partial [Nitrososphaeraceae archaeon]
SAFNDTLKTQFFKTRLSGSYTIGGASPNFITLKQATDSLQKFGVCGPVTFNLRNGVYKSKFKLAPFQGISEVNLLTFQSESLDSSLVIIVDSSEVNSFCHCAADISVSHIAFNRLTFLRHDPALNGNTLSFSGSVKNVTVRNCVFDYNSSGGANTIKVNLVGNAANGDLKFLNNYFKKNSMLYLESSTIFPLTDTTAAKRVLISSNIFDNRGINAVKLDSIVVSNNLFKNATITITRSHKEIEIFNNKILHGYFTLEKCNGNILSDKIYNNVFDSIILVMSGIPNLNFYHNTVVSRLINDYHAAIEYEGTILNQKIKNNIFYNSGFGAIYKISDPLYINPVPNKNFDYNIIYSPNDTLTERSYLGNGIYNKVSWQNQILQDEHSVFIKPTFAGTHDFHIINDHQLDNLGTNSLTTNNDLDGVLRNAAAPDIGVYEFTGVVTNDDAGIISVVNNGSNCDHSNSQLTVNLKNFGSNNLISTIIKWSINGIQQPDYTWSGNLVPNAYTPVTIGTYTSQTSNSIN